MDLSWKIQERSLCHTQESKPKEYRKLLSNVIKSLVKQISKYYSRFLVNFVEPETKK
jgi:hypothetical protein